LNQSKLLLSLIVACIAAAGRAAYLEQPMRYDESWTFLVYVNQRWLDVFNYSAPNNHVLNSLLIKLSTITWGGHPVVIRLPAFLFGLGSVFLTYRLANRLWGGGYVASLIMASMPYLILFSTNARGYSALVFFTLLFLLIGIQLLTSLDTTPLIKLSLVTSVGIFNMPVMIYPILCSTAWIVVSLVIDKKSLYVIIIKFLVPFALLTSAITTLMYLPVIYATAILNNGITNAFDLLLNNNYVQIGNFRDFSLEFLYHLNTSIRVIFRDIPLILLISIILLILIGIVVEYRQKNFIMSKILASFLLLTGGLLLLSRNIPYTRTWIYLIPVLALAADRGAHFIWSRSSQRGKGIFEIVALCGALAVVVNLVASGNLRNYSDTGTFEDGKVLGEELARRIGPGDQAIISGIPADRPVGYYMWHASTFGKPDTRAMTNSGVANRSIFIVIPNDRLKLEMKSQHPILVERDDSLLTIYPNAQKIFEYKGSVIYQAKLL
jgi:hypothetical protein